MPRNPFQIAMWEREQELSDNHVLAHELLLRTIDVEEQLERVASVKEIALSMLSALCGRTIDIHFERNEGTDQWLLPTDADQTLPELVCRDADQAAAALVRLWKECGHDNIFEEWCVDAGPCYDTTPLISIIPEYARVFGKCQIITSNQDKLWSRVQSKLKYRTKTSPTCHIDAIVYLLQCLTRMHQVLPRWPA
jgi:hypothetical protein